jgi:uncharacterized protein (UPF0332 family)
MGLNYGRKIDRHSRLADSGRMLALVMQIRETSDYSPEISVSCENAAAIIADAQAFVVEIKTFLGA